MKKCNSVLHYKKTPLPWFQELTYVQVRLVKGDQKLSQVSVLWVDDGMKDKDDGSVTGGKTVREIWRPQVVAAIYTNFNIGICVGRGRQTSDLHVTISTLISLFPTAVTWTNPRSLWSMYITSFWIGRVHFLKKIVYHVH